MEHGGSLDRLARTDANVGLAQGRKAFELDVERVVARRQRAEAHLPFLVRDDRRRPANQARRADANDDAWQHAALRVLHGPDESARQPLRGDGERKQRTGCGDAQRCFDVRVRRP